MKNYQGKFFGFGGCTKKCLLDALCRQESNLTR